jgi:hypothetical protein
MLPDGTHLRAPLLAFVLLVLCSGCAPRGEATAQSRAPNHLYPLEAPRPNIRALTHHQTEQEAKDASLRALAGIEPETALQALCNESPDMVAESLRGRPVIHLIGSDEIVQIFIPYGPRGHTVHAGPGDLSPERIEAMLFDSWIDRYERLGMYHLLPGYRFSIILKSGNHIDVQLYVTAPIGSAVAPDGCRYWFALPASTR